MATATRIEWHGASFLQKLTGIQKRRVAKVAEAVAEQLKQNISIPTSVAGPSSPGEFPHSDSGALLESVYAVVETRDGDPTALVGTGFFDSAPHAEIVEQTRPHVERTLDEMSGYIKRELTKPIF